MQVIQQLHARDDGFVRSAGWELKTWERELTLTGKDGADSTAIHKGWYIIHVTTLLAM